MKAKLQIIHSVVISHLIAFVLVARASPVPTGTVQIPGGNESNHPVSLVNLGEVGGKSFFIEPNLTMNWTDTKTYCESNNLKMVSIETKDEADFLVRTLRPYGIMWFYSALHESISPIMMEWDESRSQPDTSFLGRWGWWNVARDYQYCGMFRAQDVFPDLYFYVVRCDYAAFVACQSGL